LRRWLRDRVDRKARELLKERFQMSEQGVLTVTLLLHVTPGVPLFIQNTFPGLHRLTFWKYLAIAVPVQTLYTALIVATSGQIFLALKSYPLLLLAVALGLWGAIAFYRRSRIKSPAV
jgi:uncharacterized membrane protein YdjX (TVP38/TMEM64 family)